MVIFIVNILNVGARHRECHAPVAAHPHRPTPLPLAFQGVKVQAWQRQVSRFDRHVETTQDESQPAGVLGLDSGRRATQEEPFQTLVPEGEYRHAGSVTRNVPGYNPANICLQQMARKGSGAKSALPSRATAEAHVSRSDALVQWVA